MKLRKFKLLHGKDVYLNLDHLVGVNEDDDCFYIWFNDFVEQNCTQGFEIPKNGRTLKEFVNYLNNQYSILGDVINE
jgi:hypothetical protein